MKGETKPNRKYHTVKLVNFTITILDHYRTSPSKLTTMPVKQQKLLESIKTPSPAGIYLFKFTNENTKTKLEIYSKSTIRKAKRHH